MLEYEPGPHIEGRQAALTTAPSLPHHPSPTHKKRPWKWFEMPKYKFKWKYDRLPTRLANL